MVVACGEATEAGNAMEDAANDAAEATENAMEDAGDAMSNNTAAAQAEAASYLKETVTAVKNAGGDLTALPASAAVDNINGWIEKLGDVDGADGVVDNLTALKNELSSGDIDAGTASDVLGKLAEQTRSMEGKAPGLGTLATVLQAASDKLGGM